MPGGSEKGTQPKGTAYAKEQLCKGTAVWRELGTFGKEQPEHQAQSKEGRWESAGEAGKGRQVMRGLELSSFYVTTCIWDLPCARCYCKYFTNNNLILIPVTTLCLYAGRGITTPILQMRKQRHLRGLRNLPKVTQLVRGTVKKHRPQLWPAGRAACAALTRTLELELRPTQLT